MPTYTISIYDYNPSGIFPTTVTDSFTYSGPATADGTATITDTQTGVEGETLSALATGETATADVTVGGHTSTGSNVDAEDAWTLRDTVTGEIFEVTSMEVRSGDAEGKYLISEQPMIHGRVYEVIAYDNLPDTGTGTILSYSEVDCFTPGAMILTPRGEIPVEKLRPGDPVTTMDNGPQRIRWIGSRDLNSAALARAPHLKPVLIRAGSMGNRRDLRVSPQHRMLVAPGNSAAAGEGDASLVAAKLLAEECSGQWRVARGQTSVRYIHLLFDAHQIIFAEGAATESLFPGPMALGAVRGAARRELAGIYPDLFRCAAGLGGAAPHSYGDMARPTAGRADLRAWRATGWVGDQAATGCHRAHSAARKTGNARRVASLHGPRFH